MAVLDNAEYKQKRFFLEDDQTELAPRTYNLIIGGVLLWGIAVNALMATYLQSQILRLNYVLVLVIYFVLSLASMALVYRSDKPEISFLGFTGLAVAMGLLLTYYVSAFDEGSIRNAFLVTGAVTACMMAVSGVWPEFFRGLGRTLGIALLIAIAADLICLFLLRVNLSLIDAGVAVIFAGYIGFDWSRAQSYPKTLDNAVDCAADIYVDIVNLFVRILSIMGNSKKSD